MKRTDPFLLGPDFLVVVLRRNGGLGLEVFDLGLGFRRHLVPFDELDSRILGPFGEEDSRYGNANRGQNEEEREE